MSCHLDPSLPDYFFTLVSDSTYGRFVLNDTECLIDDCPIQFQVGELRCQGSSASIVKTRNDIDYREVTFKVGYKPGGWYAFRLDEGFRKLDPADSTKRVQILNDGDNGQLKRPAMLDGSGDVLSDPSPTNAVCKQFSVYTFAPLSQISGISDL